MSSAATAGWAVRQRQDRTEMLPLLEAMWEVLLGLAPWLLLGTVIASVLHVALPPNFVRRHLRGRSGVLRAVAAPAWSSSLAVLRRRR